MKTTKYNGYRILIEDFVSAGKQTFSTLSKIEQDELLAEWLVNECDKQEFFYSLTNGNVFEELMFGSMSNEQVGDHIRRYIRRGDHIRQINSDLDYELLRQVADDPRYVSTNDELLLDENRDRARSIRMWG